MVLRGDKTSYYEFHEALAMLKEKNKQMGSTHESVQTGLRDSNRRPVEAPRREET